MDRYKKRSIGFANVEEKRDLRFIRKSVDRANVKHKRLSELRQIDPGNLTLDEKDEKEEKTPVKQEPKKVSYLEKLKKWKEEKELKKKLEAKKKIPVFKVHRITYERPPLSASSSVASKNKESLRFVPKSASLKNTVRTTQIQKLLPPTNAVSRPIPTPKGNSRAIPAGKITPRPMTAGGSALKPTGSSALKPTGSSALKPTVSSALKATSSFTLKPTGSFTSKPTGPPTRSGVAPLKFPSINSTVTKGLKPPLTSSSTLKPVPKTRPAVGTAVATGIPKSNVPSRIVPSRTCNKQVSALTKPKSTTLNGSLKGAQPKNASALKGMGGGGVKKTCFSEVPSESSSKCANGGVEEHVAEIDSLCEEEPPVEKPKAAKSSFAPDDFTFKPPNNIKTFEYPFGGIGITAMFAKVFGVSLPGQLQETEPHSQTGGGDQTEGSSLESKVDEHKSETENKELNVVEPELNDVSNNSEVTEREPEPTVVESCAKSQIILEEKKEQKSSPSDPKDFETASDVSPSLTPKPANISAKENPPKKKSEKSKEKVKDVPLCRQLQTISENSELLNDSALESGLLGFDVENLYDPGQSTPRRSRRLASINSRRSSPLDSKYFQKCVPESADDSGSAVPFPDGENTPVLALANGFSDLSVDSPAVRKQRGSTVRKFQPENRISLLGTPPGPQTRSRKSVRGDLISFSPIV